MPKELTIGDKVRVVALPAYVKTAESMPMLRPPNVIKIGEEGTILDRKPGGYWSVRFTNGAFLLESQYIEPAREEQAPPRTESDTAPDTLAPEEN